MRGSTVEAMTKTWLITGAGRGMGVDFARAALAAGHDVEDKARLLLAQVDAHRELSTSLAHEDAKAAA